MHLAPFQFASLLYFRFWGNRQAANMAAIFPHPYHGLSALLLIRSVEIFMLIESSCRLLATHLDAIGNDNPLIIYWSFGSGSPAAKAVYGRNVGGEGRSEDLYRSPGCAWKYHICQLWVLHCEQEIITASMTSKIGVVQRKPNDGDEDDENSDGEE